MIVESNLAMLQNGEEQNNGKKDRGRSPAKARADLAVLRVDWANYVASAAPHNPFLYSPYYYLYYYYIVFYYYLYASINNIFHLFTSNYPQPLLCGCFISLLSSTSLAHLLILISTEWSP
jgi:hypothetical protein